jgi:outer membrane protein assembly factor BamD (BamD/ComL family)
VYQESARSIFKEKMASVRQQFSTAVQEHKWSEALQLADTIISDFPNTQMAKEVNEMLPTLRARASGVEPAQV